jgi:hypothetical protein
MTGTPRALATVLTALLGCGGAVGAELGGQPAAMVDARAIPVTIDSFARAATDSSSPNTSRSRADRTASATSASRRLSTSSRRSA